MEGDGYGDGIISDDIYYQVIINEAREISLALEEEMRYASRTKVPEKVSEAIRVAHDERIARDSYIEYLAKEQAAEESTATQSVSNSPLTGASPDVVCKTQNRSTDAALQGLVDICLPQVYGIAHVALEAVERGPNYDTWFPVLQNFFVSDPEVDPYRPYFGENLKDMRKAREVYQQMCGDINWTDCFEYVSDGDVDKNATLKPPTIASFHQLPQRRKREGQRGAILEIVRRYGTADAVWEALSMALGLEVRRVRLYHRVAGIRAAKADARQASRESARKHAESIKNALFYPNENFNLSTANSRGMAVAPLQHFCFTCHTFACEIHIGESVEPVNYIPDMSTNKRKIALSRRKAKPCSQRCFLLRQGEQLDPNEGENSVWTEQEVALLREGSVLFEFDACHLAILIGSRCCREVYHRIRQENEINIIKALIESSRTSPPVNVSRRTPSLLTSSRGKSTRRRERGRSGYTSPNLKSTRASSATSSQDGDGEHAMFIPCAHHGPCTSKNADCSCAALELECESTCGCNLGRFYEFDDGIGWRSDSSSGPKCQRKVMGCKCKKGNCNLETCECYRNQRACNPDFCHYCESAYLPEAISIEERRCRNTDLITGRHKLTVSGKSKVHGFGLFAADTFKKGELVGHYCGRVVDAAVVDKMLRASQAKKKTYAFNLTDKHVIEGYCLGAKVRYINHDADAPNCESRFERVRGEGRIALRTTRLVRPGEEFMFDYQITQGNEWIHSDEDDVHSDEDEIDFSQTLDVSQLSTLNDETTTPIPTANPSSTPISAPKPKRNARKSA